MEVGGNQLRCDIKSIEWESKKEQMNKEKNKWDVERHRRQNFQELI